MSNPPLGTSVKGFDDKPRIEPPPGLLRIDPLLLLAVIALIGLSCFVVGTATKDDIPGQPAYYLYRQIAYGVVGLVLLLVISQFDYSRLREWRYGLYAFMLATILVTFVIGGAAKGSTRWIDLGFFQYQSSEMGKLLLLVAISGFMVERVRRLTDRETTSRMVLLAVIPAMLVVAQPDLGSGLVYLAIVLSILFAAGTKWTHFAALGALGVTAVVIVLVAAPAVGVEVLKPYQVDRLTAFLSPTDDPREQGYQLKQSIAGIGAGQRTGRGPEGATQTQLDFIPEHHTDFIFSVVGESFGFVGCALILALYALIVWRGLRILTMAKNLFGALIAGGVVGMLLFQMFVNVGMTIGIMPITGIPLPLFSYGGSSVLMTFMAIGLLQSIHVQGKGVAAAKRQVAVGA
jgi:rod shape determining protein RodA